MRILQVADHFGPFGGLEKFIYELSRRLTSRGDETAVAVLDLDRRHAWGDEEMEAVQLPPSEEAWVSYAERFRPDLIVWHAGPETARYAARLTKLAPAAATVHSPVCPAGTRLFRDRDEICTHPAGAACLVRWYARRCGTRPEPWTALQAKFRADRTLAALKDCFRVYTVSDAMGRLIAIDGIRDERIRIMDNTFGEASQPPMPPLRVPAAEQELHLMFVGRVSYGKGAQYLLRAIRMLLDRGKSVGGTIVGDGWYTDQLRSLCRELGLERRIRFTGQVPGTDMDGFYDMADIVVVPSVWPEPAGLVVPEARRRGKPVVVFDSGGLAEWQTLMDGVYVARRADPLHLAETIEEAARGKPAARSARTWSGTGRRIDLIEDLHDIGQREGKEAVRP